MIQYVKMIFKKSSFNKFYIEAITDRNLNCLFW